MPVRVAVQMDPLATLNIAGDSTFHLMKSAQARGAEQWYYDVRSLAWEAGRITADAAPVTVQHVVGNHYTLGEVRKIDLGRDVDVVLMRQDPPFALGYITATPPPERLEGETLVGDGPRPVRTAPEKVYALAY
eukprot:gene11697-14915_t